MDKVFLKLIWLISISTCLTIIIIQCFWQQRVHNDMTYQMQYGLVSPSQVYSLRRTKRRIFPNTNISSWFSNFRKRIFERNYKKDRYGDGSEEGSAIDDASTATEIYVPEEPGHEIIASERPIVTENRTIIYTDPDLIALCNDPVFDSVDSNLDNSEIIIFKGKRFYIMERLRYGSGKLVGSGETAKLLPGFENNRFKSMVTIKEGPLRGLIYAFYTNKYFMAWKASGYIKANHKLVIKKTKSNVLPKNGFSAALHNRNVENPLIVGFDGNMVYHIEPVAGKLIRKSKMTYDKTPELFPPNLTSAISLENGFIYVFRDNQYCIREMDYNTDEKDTYCDAWNSNTGFLGCFGQNNPPFSISGYDLDYEDEALHASLCEDLNIKGITLSIDGLVYVFRDEKYWIINGFPNNIKLIGYESARDKWPGFKNDIDTMMIVQEGPLRGHSFAFKGRTFDQWSVDGSLRAENEIFPKIKAIIQNSDILNPVIIGFGEKQLYHLAGSKNRLRIKRKVAYKTSPKLWPKDITGALFLNKENIFLFKGDKYCSRGWTCKLANNCCNKWLDSSTLFGC